MCCREVHLHRDNRDEQLIYLSRFPCVVCYVQDTRTQVARVPQIFIEKLWVLWSENDLACNGGVATDRRSCTSHVRWVSISLDIGTQRGQADHPSMAPLRAV